MITDAGFRKLLDHYDRPWRGFRKVRKGVLKRIRRHMASLHCSSVSEYIDILQRCPIEEEILQSHLRITISRFNRDRYLWDFLAEHTFPCLLQRTDKLKIWSPGCSCGEEVYSLKILWHLHFSSYPAIRILATDANSNCLERAQAGIYQKTSLREISEDTVSRLFVRSPDQNGYAVRPQLKENIAWQQHNFLSQPPDETFHLIFLRNNLLTYYNEELKSAALNNILTTLSPGGYLVIGSHETLPETLLSLVCSEKCSMVFQLRNDGDHRCRDQRHP